MPQHIELKPSNSLTALAKGLLNVGKLASRQQTHNSGSVFVNDGQKNEDGSEKGTGTIINGAGSGFAPFVNDTTPPGKPTGLTAVSHNGVVLARWDGTLDGGIPSDFSHITIHAAYGGNDIVLGDLTAKGEVPSGVIAGGTIVNLYAVAYDDAHNENGESTPNSSVKSDTVTITVQSAVDSSEIDKAKQDAQDALDGFAGLKPDVDKAKSDASAASGKADVAAAAAGKAQQSADNAQSAADVAAAAASAAQSSADGKNKVMASTTEPQHGGLANGDLWFQLDSSKHVNGIKVWNGSAFVDYTLVANQLLVAGTVGATQIANGAVTTDKVTASEALLKKLLVRKIEADEIDVGQLAAAIVVSGEFKSANGRFSIDDAYGLVLKDSTGKVVVDFPTNSDQRYIVGKFVSGEITKEHIEMSTFGGSNSTYSDGSVSFFDHQNNLIGNLSAEGTNSSVNTLSITVHASGTNNPEHHTMKSFDSSVDYTGKSVYTAINGGTTTTSSEYDPRITSYCSATDEQAEIHCIQHYNSGAQTESSVVAKPDGGVYVNGIRFDRRVYNASQFVDFANGYSARNSPTFVITAGMAFLNFGYSGYTPNANVLVATLKEGFRTPDQYSGVASVWGQAGSYVINPNGEIYVASGGADQYSGSFQVFWQL